MKTMQEFMEHTIQQYWMTIDRCTRSLDYLNASPQQLRSVQAVL